MVAIGTVIAVYYAMSTGADQASRECLGWNTPEGGSDKDRACGEWLAGDGPVLVVTAVAAALSSLAVWFRRPEPLVLVAILGFGMSGLFPLEEIRRADPYAPVEDQGTRASSGTPVTLPPDTRLVPPPPGFGTDLRTREQRFDDDAYMTSVNVLRVVGECIVKSHSSPRSCERPEIWQRTGIATDARVTVSIRNRDRYRVDAASAVPPVVYSASFDDRAGRILYLCRPAPSRRCGEGRAEEKLPRP